MIDYKELYENLKTLFELEPPMKNMTLEELRDSLEQHNKNEKIKDLYNDLRTIAEEWENSDCYNDPVIVVNLKKIHAITDDADTEKEPPIFKNPEVTAIIESLLPVLESLLEYNYELEDAALKTFYKYVIYELIDENASEYNGHPNFLNAYNIREIVKEFNIPSIFSYCTEGVLMSMQYENVRSTVLIPFGAKIVDYGKQMLLFDNARPHVSLQWDGKSLDIYGATDNPCIVYEEQEDIIPLEEIFTADDLVKEESD